MKKIILTWIPTHDHALGDLVPFLSFDFCDIANELLAILHLVVLIIEMFLGVPNPDGRVLPILIPHFSF